MSKKIIQFIFALAFAIGAIHTNAAIVEQDLAMSAASGFLAKSSVAKRVLADRSVESVEQRGNLWIAHLSPSGHIGVAGSTKCAPIVFFSTLDFVEPEADSPFAEKLASDSLRVAEKEADATSEDNGAWAKLIAPVVKKRVLLAAAPHSADSDEYLAPFIGASWSQNAPMNSLTPRNAVCGCTATAGGQELRYWRWPYRFEKSRTTTHVLYDASNNTSLYAIRMDGRVPFNYDKITDRQGTAAPQATDKEIPYNTAYLTAWVQSMVIVDFKPGAASGNKKLNEYADQYWYEKGTTMSRSRDGYMNLWNAIKADLDWGSPIQINTANHQMVVVGYAVDNAGTEDEVDWVNVNFGWGRDTSVEWYNLEVETSENATTAAKTFADFQIGYHPQKIVQFEPVPKVSEETVHLTWHIAPCYTNRIDRFNLDVVKLGEQTTFNDDFSASTGTVDSPGNNFKIENGYLGGYPVANQTSTYTYPEEFHISESSVLSFNAKSRYMGAYHSDSGTHTATVEVFPNNGPWETLDTIPLSGSSSLLIADKAIDLSVYAGKTIKLRFKFVTGAPTVGVGGSADFIIDNVAVTNIRYADEKTYSTSIEKAADMPSVYSYDVTGLDDGCAYAFNVTPVMSDGADALTNFTTTRIGTPNTAPSIDNVSSVACGLELVQQGFYIECAREIINDIVVTCNESTTELLAYPSHISALPDEKVSVTKDGNVFTVRLDARGMQNVWDGDMMLLTLVAKNADGTEASKNLMLRFNSMRQVLDGTFDVVEADADSAVWFCGTTTIDAKGEDVVFAPGVFMGTGNITLTDTAGGGSFTFQGLDGFTGTLAFAGGTDVAFQGDMSGFSGTIKVTGGTYTLSSDLPSAMAELNIVSGAQVVLDNASIACALSGGKSIAVSSGTSSITSQILSSADILLSGGILEVALTEAEVAYGYSGSPNISISGGGTLKFVDPSGNTLPHAVGDGVYSVAGNAKVWTGNDAWAGATYYTDNWAGNVPPADGDYAQFVIPDDTGAKMNLNLSEARNLKYVKVTGEGQLEISDTSSATLTIDTFQNEVQVAVNSAKLKLKKVVPAAYIVIGSGNSLDCEVDQSLSGYIKKVQNYSYVSALTDSSLWNGTVVFSSFDAYWLDLNNYGNQESKVRLNGVSGYLMYSNPTFNTTVELVDNGATPAFHWNDGAGGSTATFFALSGTGTFKTSGSSGNSEMIVINSIDDFAGSFDLASKTVAIGTEIGSTSTAGRLNLNNGKSATIALGKTWKVVGGVYLAGNQTITVNGTLNGAITAEGTGTTLALKPTSAVTAASLNMANNTISIEKSASAASAVTVSGEANLAGSTIAVTLSDEATDSIALMSAGSFTGVDTATLTGIDDYELAVEDGVLYAKALNPGYSGPEPAATWVSWEFEDEASKHNGYAVSTNNFNTIDENGNILIGSDSTLGATITLPGNTYTQATILVKFELPKAGAPVANASIAGVISSDNNPIGAYCAAADGTSLTGYWLNANGAIQLGNSGYNFSTTPVTSAGEGYMLLAYCSELANPMSKGTALYTGSSLENLTGGNVSGLQWKTKKLKTFAIGGPVAEGNAKPWAGMVVKGVALFVDKWLTPGDIAGYEFPEPEEPVRTDVHYKSGFWGEGGQNPFVVVLDNDKPTTVLEGETVIIDAKSSDVDTIYFGSTLPENANKIRVSRDVIFSSGANNPSMLDGATITVDEGVTLTFKRQWNNIVLGSVTIDGPGAVKFDQNDGTITIGGSLSGTAEVTVETGKQISVSASGSIANTISGDGMVAYASMPSVPMPLAANWTGTVELPEYSANAEKFDNYGNANSTVKINGYSGWLNWTELGNPNKSKHTTKLNLIGALNVTDASGYDYIFDQITGTGSISFPEDDTPNSVTITDLEVPENTTGITVNNNMPSKQIRVANLILPSNASVAPGTRVLAVGGNGTVAIGTVKIGSAVQTLQLERRNKDEDGDGLYVKVQIETEGEGENEVVTVVTESEQESVEVPVANDFTGTIVVAPTVKSIDTDTSIVSAEQVKVKYGGNDITGAFTVSADLSLALDENGKVNDVDVKPAIDEGSSIDEGKLTVRTIPGLWYGVNYGDALEGGDIGGTSGNTTPEQATGFGDKELSAPKDGACKFYRVRVGARSSDIE